MWPLHGGGEVAHYLGRHGTKRAAKAVLIGEVAPLMLKTDKNPGGLPIDAFDQIRAGVIADRSQFYRDLTLPFYGYNRPGAKISKACGSRSGCKGCWDRSRVPTTASRHFPRRISSEDLKKIDVPTLILHGDDDQIVPIGRLGQVVLGSS